MNKDAIRRFLVSCEFKDAPAMAVLMEGCRAHAEVDAFPLWTEDLQIRLETFQDRLPHIAALEDTWVAIFPTRASLECFAELMSSIDFKAPDYIRFVDFDTSPGVDLIWTMDQFHKYVFHGQ